MGGVDVVSGFSGSYWGHARLNVGHPWCTIRTMEAHIYSVAVRASGFLLSPLVWATFVASFLALSTGLAGRVAVLAEDLRSARIRGSNT